MSCTPSTTRITSIRREGEGGTGLTHLGVVALSFHFYLLFFSWWETGSRLHLVYPKYELVIFC
jgi:hypothetical protein